MQRTKVFDAKCINFDAKFINYDTKIHHVYFDPHHKEKPTPVCNRFPPQTNEFKN